MVSLTAFRRGNPTIPRPASGLGWAIAVAVLPVLASLHLILHLLTPSPIYPYSGLATGIGHLFPPYPTIDFNVGVLSEAQGRRAALEIMSGHMPWWNFYEGAGTPLAGNMQSSALFPPSLLLLLPDGLLYLHLLLQSIAGLFTYLLMRRLGAGPFAAFTAGVLFEFNGTFAWLPTEPIAFLPMLLYAVELEMAQVAGAWRWVAVALALSIYAGFPEMAYIDGLLVAVWTLARLATGPEAQRLKAVLHIGLGVACGLLLCAPILIAFADYLAVGFYSLHSNGFLGQQHLNGHYAIALALPYLFGLLFNEPHDLGVMFMWCTIGGFTGAGLLTLGVLGIAGRKHRGLRAGLVLWLCFCAAAAYGLPGGKLLIHAALLGNAAFFRYFNPSLSMALAVLAGLALDDLTRDMTRRRYFLALGTVSVLLLLGLANAWHSVIATRPVFWPLLSLAIAAVILGGAAFAWGRPAAQRRRILGVLVIAEALFNFLLPSFENPRHPKLELGGIHFLQAHVGYQRVFAMGPMEPNYGSYFGIAEIDDCDFPIPASWFAYRQKHLDPYAGPLLFDGHARFTPVPSPPAPEAVFAQNMAAYEATGVRYVLTKPDAVLAPDLHLPRVYSDSVMSIFELPDPRPYFDAPGCTLTPRSRNDLVADCATPAVLTRLELFMPGWRVRVNNEKVPISETGEVFQQISLPAGKADIRFYFLPPFMRLGYALFFAGFLFFCMPMRMLRFCKL